MQPEPRKVSDLEAITKEVLELLARDVEPYGDDDGELQTLARTKAETAHPGLSQEDRDATDEEAHDAGMSIAESVADYVSSGDDILERIFDYVRTVYEEAYLSAYEQAVADLKKQAAIDAADAKKRTAVDLNIN